MFFKVKVYLFVHNKITVRLFQFRHIIFWIGFIQGIFWRIKWVLWKLSFLLWGKFNIFYFALFNLSFALCLANEHVGSRFPAGIIVDSYRQKRAVGPSSYASLNWFAAESIRTCRLHLCSQGSFRGSNRSNLSQTILKRRKYFQSPPKILIR
jgi:hypothetical protein